MTDANARPLLLSGRSHSSGAGVAEPDPNASYVERLEALARTARSP